MLEEVKPFMDGIDALSLVYHFADAGPHFRAYDHIGERSIVHVLLEPTMCYIFIM